MAGKGKEQGTIKGGVEIDPELDLVLERVVDVAPRLVWKAWTEPEHLMRWFTPVPWKTVACEIDLRPGGAFGTTMQSPEGEQFPGTGCYLEVVPEKRLVWTSAMGPGYRPTKPGEGPFLFTAFILMEQEGTGTRYTALAKHAEATARKAHEVMGFQDGWGKALDQLVAWAKTVE